MHEYIRTLAGRLSSPGSAVRAQGLFDQAMQKTRFRWGRRAKLAAGASLAIALRESQKSDSLRDIAVSTRSHTRVTVLAISPLLLLFVSVT